mmetsp:Transcript_11156/g.34179  ORF Transcript_11156/g.34179 Transcript_11156/m.34179 type:complete len:535 (+) Transcript_11156:269-1873(+)
MAGIGQGGPDTRGIAEGAVSGDRGNAANNAEDGLFRVSEMFTRGTTERRFDDLWLRTLEGKHAPGRRLDSQDTEGGTKKRCTLRLVPLPRDRNSDMRNQEDFVVAMASRPGMIEHFINNDVPNGMDEIRYLRELSRLNWRRGDWAVQLVHFDRRNVGAIWIHQQAHGYFHVVADLCELFTESGCPKSLLDAVLVGLSARLSLKAGVEKVMLCGRSVTAEIAGRVQESLARMKFKVSLTVEKCNATGKDAYIIEMHPPVGARDKDCEEEMSRLMLMYPVVNQTPTLSIVEEVQQPLFTVIGWQQSQSYQDLVGSVVESVEKDMNVYFFIRLETPFNTSKNFDFRLQVLSADGEPVNCSYRFKEPFCYRQRIVLYADEWVRGDESVGFIPYQKGPLNVVLEMKEAFVPNGIVARRIVKIREVVKGKKRVRSSDDKDFRRKRFGLDSRPDVDGDNRLLDGNNMLNRKPEPMERGLESTDRGEGPSNTNDNWPSNQQTTTTALPGQLAVKGEGTNERTNEMADPSLSVAPMSAGFQPS